MPNFRPAGWHQEPSKPKFCPKKAKLSTNISANLMFSCCARPAGWPRKSRAQNFVQYWPDFRQNGSLFRLRGPEMTESTRRRGASPPFSYSFLIYLDPQVETGSLVENLAIFGQNFGPDSSCSQPTGRAQQENIKFAASFGRKPGLFRTTFRLRWFQGPARKSKIRLFSRSLT